MAMISARKAALLVWALDTAERVTKSFLVGWLGAWLVIQDRELAQLFAGDTLGAGAAAAAGSLLLALGARQIGSQASASWLPGLLPKVPIDLSGKPAAIVEFDGRDIPERRGVRTVEERPRRL